MKKFSFTCSTCGAHYEDLRFRCDCGEPLDLQWNGCGIDTTRRDMPGRYGAFFPFETNEWVSLQEGMAPLVPLEKLRKELGLNGLWVKNESANPTWSFKDRGTAACVTHAKNLGFDTVGTVSTGNMAPSVAAYAAAAGMKSIILVKGDVVDEKMGPIAIYGARLIRVQGAYDQLYALTLKIGTERGIYFANSDVPMRAAGSRTIAFEIAEDLKFEVPDWVIVPTSAGGNIRGIFNGFSDLLRFGYTKRMPSFLCAQASQCSPIVTAFSRGKTEVSPFPNPHTIAHAIENPFPPSGNRVLAMLHGSSTAISASESEIIQSQADLAHCGLFGQPASCLPLACLRTARKLGIVKEGQRVVSVMTGSGLKYTAAFASHKLKWEDCTLEELPQRLV